MRPQGEAWWCCEQPTLATPREAPYGWPTALVRGVLLVISFFSYFEIYLFYHLKNLKIYIFI